MAPMAIKKQRSNDRMLRHEVLAERRRNSIQSREAERIASLAYHAEKQAREQQLVSSKYAKQDVIHLKQIFDSYDIDDNGSIERGELRLALQKQKKQVQHFDGKKKTLEERQAERGHVQSGGQHKEGVFLVDFSDALFRAMDTNTDGKVEFDELLRLLYPYASDAELNTMLSWVWEEAPQLTYEEFQLNDEQRREIRSMFVLYDKDRSGTISRSEFRQAMRRCGLDSEEIDETFSEADADGNKSIDLAEFTELMKRTLFENSEKLTAAMLYAPI